MTYLFWSLRKSWHCLIMRVFRSHFTDEVTDMLHPEFGWYWHKGEEGDNMLDSSYRRGFDDGWDMRAHYSDK